MRRLWKTGVSLLLAVSLMLGNIPITAQAAKTAKTQNTEVTDVKETKRQKKSQEDVEVYADGEAIILYDTSAAKTTKSALSSMDGDIKIVQSYDFEEASVSTQSASAQGGSGISVSLVKSDKLSTDELVKQLSNRKDIRYAEPNYRIKATDIGDYSKYQWALNNEGQNMGTSGLDVNADSLVTSTEEEVVIALVDTGIDYNHPDLANVVWTNPKKSSKFKGDHGYDFINYDEDPLDDNGHGTHCSGIMAATDEDGTGISGVASSNNVKIMALKMLDEQGYGYGMEAVGAYNYIYKAQQEGINVVAVNNSWGGVGDEESFILATLIELVGQNGALSICAAGNSADDNDVVSSLPANFESPYVVSVAASNEKDELATFSCYGANSVDIAAPGANILSSVSYDCYNPGIYENPEELSWIYNDYTNSDITFKQILSEEEYTEEYKADPTIADGAIAYGLSTFGGVGTSTLTYDSNKYFGPQGEDEKSLQWKITGAEAGEMYYLYFPYTVEEANKNHSVSVTATATGPAGGTVIDPFWGEAYVSTLYVADGPLVDGVYDEWNEYLMSGMEIMLNQNYWSQASATMSVKKGETRAISIQVYTEEAGDYVVNIDDLGISSPNVEPEAFGKYAYYNGTSMATPHVTGAVAALASAYSGDGEDKGEDALALKARLLGSTRKSDSLTGKVSTGGVLDLSKADSPNMSVDYINMCQGCFEGTYEDEIEMYEEDMYEGEMHAANMIEIYGSYLLGATVKVDGEVVEPTIHTDNLIQVDGNDWVNKTATITLTKENKPEDASDDDVLLFTRFFAMGQPFEYGWFANGSLTDGNVVSDGNTLYHVDYKGIVSTGVPTEVDGMKSLTWESGYMGFMPYIFGDEYVLCVEGSVTKLTDAVYGDGKLWTVAKLDVGYSECTAVLSYDSMNGWMKVAEVPEELMNVEGYSIAYYNGEVYLLGGYNASENVWSDTVYQYVPVEDSWEEDFEDMEIDGEGIEDEDMVEEEEAVSPWNEAGKLPANRVYAKTLQVNDKLVVTLGGSDNDNQFNNLIFDGETWTVGESAVDINTNVNTYTFGATDVNVADAQIGVIDGGIVYTDSFAEGLGDTYLYDVASDSYTASDYMLDSATLSAYYDHMYATTVQNDLYVIFGFEETLIEDWMAAKNLTVTEEYDDEIILGNLIDVFTMPVDTGFVQLVDASEEGVTLTNAGYRIPGDTIPLMFATEKDYYIKSVAVNGEELESFDGTFSYTLPLTADSEVIEVVGKAGAYVTEIALPETQEIAPGESVQLKAEILPTKAENKELVWFSEDEDMVFVDEEGNISVSEDAEIGTEVIITAMATDREITEDGGVVMAECTVVITEAGSKEEPKEPTDSNAPTDPNGPADPNAPTDPNGPTDPNAPTDPNGPTDPNTPADPNAPGSTEEKVTPAVGDKVTLKKCTYKVLTNSSKSRTVAFVSLNNKKATSVTIPKTVKINKKTFKVTKVSSNAFKDCKKLKKITIGKNVTSIGKNAFKNCTKLQKITVKSTKITKISKNKIDKKVMIKVPKSAKKKYKRLFKKAGYKGTLK